MGRNRTLPFIADEWGQWGERLKRSTQREMKSYDERDWLEEAMAALADNPAKLMAVLLLISQKRRRFPDDEDYAYMERWLKDVLKNIRGAQKAYTEVWRTEFMK